MPPPQFDELELGRLAGLQSVRRGFPDDTAAACQFLASPGDFITGQLLTVDGGRSNP